MKLRVTDDGSYEIDESGCAASYAWWGPPPDVGGPVLGAEYGDDDPVWVTSFCVLDTGPRRGHLRRPELRDPQPFRPRTEGSAAVLAERPAAVRADLRARRRSPRPRRRDGRPCPVRLHGARAHHPRLRRLLRMTWWNELRLVCCAVLALAAIIAVVFAGILLFGKEGRQRRATSPRKCVFTRPARRQAQRPTRCRSGGTTDKNAGAASAGSWRGGQHDRRDQARRAAGGVAGSPHVGEEGARQLARARGAAHSRTALEPARRRRGHLHRPRGSARAVARPRPGREPGGAEPVRAVCGVLPGGAGVRGSQRHGGVDPPRVDLALPHREGDDARVKDIAWYQEALDTAVSSYRAVTKSYTKAHAKLVAVRLVLVGPHLDDAEKIRAIEAILSESQ
ncbi:hypothetical protein Q3G72_019192 [Acer saccharum]|nr:hypothetical protein Q3G72_019192 [Acer saccharum]